MNSTAVSSALSEAIEALQNAYTAIRREALLRLEQYATDTAHWNDQTLFGIAGAMDLVLQSLIGTLYLQEPALLDDQIVCLNKNLRCGGTTAESLLRGLQILAETIQAVLPPASSVAVFPYLQHILVQQLAHIHYAPPTHSGARLRHHVHCDHG